MSDIKFDCPKCKQSLQVSSDMAGMTVECPSCKTQIELVRPQVTASKPPPIAAPIPTSRDANSQPCPFCGESILKIATKCKHCGEFLQGRPKVVDTNVKQGALIGAAVCFIVGMGALIFSSFLVIIYAPLFLASFILSIVAMAQKRVVGGVLMLLANVIIPPVVMVMSWYNFHNELKNKLGEAVAEMDATNATSRPASTAVTPVGKSSAARQKEAANDYKSLVALYDFNAKYFDSLLDGKVPGVEFKLKNKGTRTLKEVKVTVFFKDTAGKVIAEENYYPVNTESWTERSGPLKPNYVWQMERGKFLTAKKVPDEWKEGSAVAEITGLEFAE